MYIATIYNIDRMKALNVYKAKQSITITSTLRTTTLSCYNKIIAIHALMQSLLLLEHNTQRPMQANNKIIMMTKPPPASPK